VTPQLVIAVGAAVLGVGLALLLSFGPRYRVGRLIDDIDALYRELLSESGLPQPPSSGTPRTTASSSTAA